jgi:hypothetical protein
LSWFLFLPLVRHHLTERRTPSSEPVVPLTTAGAEKPDHPVCPVSSRSFRLLFILCANNSHTRFKIKSRYSSHACPGSSCHTYGQNVNTEKPMSLLYNLYYMGYCLYKKTRSTLSMSNQPGAMQAFRINLHLLKSISSSYSKQRYNKGE